MPEVRPTVVCSTRDRNILAIESEVRGAIANGVQSFLVVQGDMLPEVEHWSNSYEIVEYLRALQASVAPIEVEVGMSPRSRRGGQFFTTGPVMDPASVPEVAERLELRPDDPPVYLEIAPPFSAGWAHRMESVGAIPISEELRQRLEKMPGADARAEGWRAAKDAATAAREAGFAGIVLMGLRFSTVVGEAYDVWHAST